MIDTTDEEWECVVNVNINSYFNLARAAMHVANMKKRADEHLKK